MRPYFIGGNWKMYGTKSSISALIKNLSVGLGHFSSADVVVFPSFVYLENVASLLKNTPIDFGAQNINEHESGAFTGEVSPAMLKDLHCHYVLVGHSERRQLFGETNEKVAEKFAAALSMELTPVLCVGETKTQREQNQTEEVVLAQLNAVIQKAGIHALEKVVIAYEPVWAIGTGLTATPDQAQAVHAFIRETIAKQDADIAQKIRIIYGGSVKASNAKELFSQPDIDGGLVGGASLKAEEFIEICQASVNE